MSCAPHLVQDVEQNQCHAAPDKYDFLLAIVSDDGQDPGVHRISAWVARCDDCLGSGSAVPPLEVNLIIVLPKRGKCVRPAGFCVNECIRIVP
jgi:hypothetical protein